MLPPEGLCGFAPFPHPTQQTPVSLGQLFPGFKGLGPQPSLFSVWPSGLDAPGEGGHLGGA